MKKLFQNKFLTVIIIISILLVGTTSFISALGYTSYIRNAIGIVLTPIQKGANTLFDSIESIFSSKEDYNKLKKQNEELKLQLAQKNDEIAKAELALKENQELKEYLGIKSEHTDLVFENAEVTGRQSASHSSVYTVNKGTHHGITPGMAVINQYGLIGCVTEVGLTWSKVTPFIHPDVSVGIALERTGEKAVTKGSFTAAKEGCCIVSYLSEISDIQVGDRIVTSDESSLYPKDILLGSVEKIDFDPLSRERIAYVSPAANLTEVQSVMIITDYNSVYE